MGLPGTVSNTSALFLREHVINGGQSDYPSLAVVECGPCLICTSL